MFNHLDGALRQAASIREMSQSGNLSDQDRRQRAGDAAMLLMNLMTQMGLDDDEKDEDDDEDENGSRKEETEDQKHVEDDEQQKQETAAATTS